MKRFILIFLLLYVFYGQDSCLHAKNTIGACNLTCEYLNNPLCISTDAPRLGWQITSSDPKTRDVRQASYRILVASSPEILNNDKGDLWDSGTVQSDATQQIVYRGKTLDGVRECFWKVRVTDDKGKVSDWSQPATWGNPLASWSAQWIGDRPDTALKEYTDYVASMNKNHDFDEDKWRNPPTLPSPLLRKTFEVTDSVKRATLYASAIGYYKIWVNGKEACDHQLAPEWTDYADHVQYQAYDITPLLAEGANAISATLADGWALGRLAGIKWMRNFPHRGFYARDRRLIAQIDLELANGQHIVVPTDSSWKIKADGYIISADNFAGETIDAGRIPRGWHESDFDDSAWDAAYVDTAGHTLVPQPNEAIKVHAALSPVKIWEREGKYMVDFGQNIAGHCELSVKGEPGQQITVRHGEWLNTDGSLYTQSLGYATATDRFILSGGDDHFEPDMTYHGFQYVEIDGLKSPLKASQITAKAISSAAPAAGAFSCSNPDLNRLYRNIVWTQRNNMLGVMTDNPSRDERTGATGDIQIFAQTAIFNMNMAPFFTKFVADMKDVAPNGQFFSMIPSLRNRGQWDGWIGAPGWCEAGLIVPWRMYVNYGDRRALEALYPEMCRHIETTVAENPSLIWKVRHNHNGDWLNANTVSPDVDPTFDTRHGATPDDMFATAFLAYSTQLLADISSVLGHEKEKARYTSLASAIRKVYADNYVKPNGRVDGDTQGAYALSLFYNLIPDSLREKSFSQLLRCIEEYDYRLSTGFITTPMMMQTLSDFGRSDIAYRLLTSDRFPSWLYIVHNGASTVWERWDAWSPEGGFQNPGMNSLDHVAFGSVAEWMFRHILGINPDESRPGYSHFLLSPDPGGGLEWAKGSYDTLHGKIDSAWHTDGKKTVYSFTIPANCEATVILPAGESSAIRGKDAPRFSHKTPDTVEAVLGSGSYTVEIVG